MTQAKEISPGLVIQGFAPPLALSDFKLIAFDMDSTLINIECVDEIADAAGLKAEVAAITEATMRGEITDFKESLRRRVALLRGVTVADMERVYVERLQLNPGADRTGGCLQGGGAEGAAGLGRLHLLRRPHPRSPGNRLRPLQRARNRIGSELRAAHGPHGEPALGRHLRRRGETQDAAGNLRPLGISPKQAIAVGDGANDLPMMGEAGLSVAYHAKPKVREQAMVAINEGGLDRLLEVVR